MRSRVGDAVRVEEAIDVAWRAAEQSLEGLDGLTWLRFVLWFAAGLLVYALYGYHHSLLRKPR